jgi:hypothetical protein
MKLLGVKSAAAILVLAAIVTPSAAAAAGPAVAAQSVRLTYISMSCPSYQVVPANANPTTFDQTGGHGAQLDKSYQTVMANPATDLPGICTRADGWQFRLYNDQLLTTTVGSVVTTGADGAGTGAATITFTPQEISLAQMSGSPAGLWTAEAARPAVGSFGALRCFSDITNGDNIENIQGIGTGDLQMYCIVYNVAPATTFHAITPARILDTRIGKGLSGKIAAGVPATFGVAGKGGVPAGAVAVTGNVTIADPTFSWAVYLGPNPVPNPKSSTVNFAAGGVASNGVTVALSATGTLSATYLSTPGNTTDLIFDVTGYFTPDTTGATYHAIAPARLLDTRFGNGFATSLTAGTPASFVVAGRDGVPATAVAVTGNLTVVNETSSWAVYLGPVAEASPATSNLNFDNGETKSNNLTVALGAGGHLFATYLSNPGNTTDLVFDVTGYYTADLTGAKFVPISPLRLLDTRSGNGLSGKIGANSPAGFKVAGRAGIPAGALSVTGNLTVVDDSGPWAVYLGPAGIALPSTSTLNFAANATLANGITVGIGAGGKLFATYMAAAGSTTDLVLDVTGYFEP